MRSRIADPGRATLLGHVTLLRDCVALAQRRWGFSIEAAVVLPDRLELLAGFGGGDVGAGTVGTFVQTTFNRHAGGSWGGWDGAVEVQPVEPAAVPLRKRFIETAPVREGLVDAPQDWPYSSRHRAAAPVPCLGAAVA